MGLTAKNVADQCGISRQDADGFGFRSHTLALKAIKNGKFNDEIVPLVMDTTFIRPDGQPQTSTVTFYTDESMRHNPDLETMARLKPVVKTSGPVAVGNSDQTSDRAMSTEIMGKGLTEAFPKV